MAQNRKSTHDTRGHGYPAASHVPHSRFWENLHSRFGAASHATRCHHRSVPLVNNMSVSRCAAGVADAEPPCRQPRGKLMVYLFNSHLKRWHLWEIDLRFAFNSTLGLHGVNPKPETGVALGGDKCSISTLGSGRTKVQVPTKFSTGVTSIIRETPTVEPCSSICLGPYGGPRGRGCFS